MGSCWVGRRLEAWSTWCGIWEGFPAGREVMNGTWQEQLGQCVQGNRRSSTWSTFKRLPNMDQHGNLVHFTMEIWMGPAIVPWFLYLFKGWCSRASWPKSTWGLPRRNGNLYREKRGFLQPVAETGCPMFMRSRMFRIWFLCVCVVHTISHNMI